MLGSTADGLGDCNWFCEVENRLDQLPDAEFWKTSRAAQLSSSTFRGRGYVRILHATSMQQLSYQRPCSQLQEVTRVGGRSSGRPDRCDQILTYIYFRLPNQEIAFPLDLFPASPVESPIISQISNMNCSLMLRVIMPLRSALRSLQVRLASPPVSLGAPPLTSLFVLHQVSNANVRYVSAEFNFIDPFLNVLNKVHIRQRLNAETCLQA